MRLKRNELPLGLILALGLWLVVWFGSYARSIRGVLKERSGEVMAGVLVSIRDASDAPVAFVRSGSDGRYAIECADSLAVGYNLVFSFLGFKPLSIPVAKAVDGGEIVMEESSINLKEVVVRVPPIKSRGDTLTYDVASFQSLSDRSIEDVLKKMPGISVEENGRIYYNGEAINKFYIEGLDALNGRYVMATRNISPDDVAAVNVYENHQAKKVLQDIETTDKAAINLKLKRKSLLKPIGYVIGGGGAGHADQARWLGEGFGMLIGSKMQTIASVKGNNSGRSYSSETRSMIPEGETGSTVAYGMFPRPSYGGLNIPSSRFLFNTSLMATANSLVKIGEDMTIAFNADYSDDNNRYYNAETISYVADGGADVVFNESSRGRNHRREAKFSVRLEKNVAEQYIRNTTSFVGHFNWSGRDVGNGSRILQTAGTDDYNLRNAFEGIFRFSKSLIDLKANIEAGTTPVEKLSVEKDGDAGYVDQRLKGLFVKANATMGYSWLLSGSSSIGLNGIVRSRYDRFESMGEAGGEALTGNDVGGYYLTVIAEPAYQYRPNSRLQVNLVVPVQLFHSDFSDALAGRSHRNERVDVDVKATVNYSMAGNVKSVWTVGYQSRLGGITDFIMNPVYVNYNQLSSPGTGLLGLRRSVYAMASLSFRNTIEGIFSSLNITYRRGESDHLSGLEVTPDEIVTNVSQGKNHSEMANITGSVSKKVFSWNTLFAFDGGWEYMSKTVIRNSGLMGLGTMSLVLHPSITSTPVRHYLDIGVDVSYSRMLQRIKAVGFSTGRSDLTCKLTVSTHPVRSLELGCDVAWRRNEVADGVFKSSAFVDCGVKYTWRIFELGLSARNLCNVGNYSYSYLVDSNLYTYTFSLRPMEMIASLKVSF